MEFRWGHNVYLVFALSFLNFLLITYRLLIERILVLEDIFPNLTIYAAFIILIYIPSATLIGHYHRKKQLKVDVSLQAEQNPYLIEILERLKNIEEKLEND
jgi:hypothetical protein